MHYFKKIFVVSVIALLVPLSASGTPYFVFTDSGGSRHDGDESGITYKNEQIYWSSTTANVLQYIGWGKVPGHYPELTDDELFFNYPGFRTNKSEFTGYGWNWYFNNSKQSKERPGWSKPDKAEGGFYQGDTLHNYKLKLVQGQRMVMGGSKGWYIGEIQGLAHTPAQPVPEPGTLLLMGLGMFGLAYSIRSRWQRDS